MSCIICILALADKRFPFAAVEGGVKLAIRLSPKASRNQIEGVFIDVDGQAVLKASVTTVPENGKANKSLIKLLSKELKLVKTMISLVSGSKDRNKVLMITGETNDLLSKLDKWSEAGNE